jgi:hypothetical protein
MNFLHGHYIAALLVLWQSRSLRDALGRQSAGKAHYQSSR